jgi:type IX secretion system PorP/SprF family membrane protein
MYKKAAVFIVSIFSLLQLPAQDIHFSQPGSVPFYFNPATTGLMSHQYRLSVNTKIQWSSVSTPYQTYLAGFDAGLRRKGSYLDMFGAGIDIMREKAGDAGFGTSGFGLSLSYIKALNRLNNEFLSFGASFRIHQRSFDSNPLTFDNQFNGQFFDATLPGGESFTDLNFWYPVVGLGVAYLNRFDAQHELKIGMSLMNFNRPIQSHFADNNIRLRTRWMGSIAYRSPIGRDRELIPSAFVSVQGPFREILAGFDYRLIKSYNRWDYTAFSGGLFYRFGDAFVVTAHADYLNYRFGVSYDVNVSTLSQASHLRGGFEFSLMMVFDQPERKKNREIPCPIF